MNVHRYDEDQRRHWVREKLAKKKSVRQIMQEAAISRATLYNWIEEFGEEQEMKEIVPETDYLNKWASGNIIPNQHIPTAADMPGTRYKMLLSALGKVDADGEMSRKMVAVLVRRFTLSVAQACEMVGIDEETYGYKPRKPEVDDQVVYEALVALLAETPTLSFIELYERIRRSTPDWPRKQVKRVYRERRLYLQRTRSRRMPREKVEETTTVGPRIHRLDRTGSCWDPVFITLGENDDEWILAIADDADGVPLNAVAGAGTIAQEEVIAFLNLAMEENGAPRKLRLPGKFPFTEKELQRWAWGNKIAIQTLNMNKPENEEEVLSSEQKLKTELLSAGGENLTEKIDAWLGQAMA